jgi:tRNA U34 5-methylaminomethyl-2-thiouridine-forming methyltransferase MnmC
MNRIVCARASAAYTLELLFDNGTSGIVDLSSRPFGPVFEPLRDPRLFSQVRVDEYGAICRPNGADLALTPFSGWFLHRSNLERRSRRNRSFRMIYVRMALGRDGGKDAIKPQM